MNFIEMTDKRNILLLLGCYCNDPKLALSEETTTTPSDYPEEFHRTIFGAVYNLAKKGSSVITSTEIENEISPFNGCLTLWEKNDGQRYIEIAKEETQNKILNCKVYRENVRKYSLIRSAKEQMGMDISFIYDEEDINKMTIFNNLSSKDIMKLILDKFTNYKDQWNDTFNTDLSYKMGEGARDLIDRFKKQEDIFGFPFQNDFMNTITKGMRGSKLLINSSKSGGGKSRSMIGESCNIGTSKMYNWTTNEWVSLGEIVPVLFISTELTQEEMESACLAHISGIPQDKIEEWNLTQEEIIILEESALIMENSKVFTVEMPQFSCAKILEVVERYVIKENIEYLFFDYINECGELSAEANRSSGGGKLRTDQVLYNFAMELKTICNRFNIHLRTATQLSSNYKDEKDASAIKSAKSIIEKADLGMITLPVTETDLKKLKPILDKGFFGKVNMGTYIYKNRGGRWKDVIVWSRFDLGTCREEGVFVTDYSYNLITNIQPTQIDIDFAGMVRTSDLFEEIESSAEETLNEFKSAK